MAFFFKLNKGKYKQFCEIRDSIVVNRISYYANFLVKYDLYNFRRGGLQWLHTHKHILFVKENMLCVINANLHKSNCIDYKF